MDFRGASNKEENPESCSIHVFRHFGARSRSFWVVMVLLHRVEPSLPVSNTGDPEQPGAWLLQLLQPPSQASWRSTGPGSSRAIWVVAVGMGWGWGVCFRLTAGLIMPRGQYLPWLRLAESSRLCPVALAADFSTSGGLLCVGSERMLTTMFLSHGACKCSSVSLLLLWPPSRYERGWLQGAFPPSEWPGAGDPRWQLERGIKTKEASETGGDLFVLLIFYPACWERRHCVYPWSVTEE